MDIKEKKKEAMGKAHTLVRVTKRGNKVDKTLDTTMGKAQLVMWALQNTSPSKRCVIFESDSLLITDIITGDSSGFPKVEKDIYERELYVELETGEVK